MASDSELLLLLFLSFFSLCHSTSFPTVGSNGTELTTSAPSTTALVVRAKRQWGGFGCCGAPIMPVCCGMQIPPPIIMPPMMSSCCGCCMPVCMPMCMGRGCGCGGFGGFGMGGFGFGRKKRAALLSRDAPVLRLTYQP